MAVVLITGCSSGFGLETAVAFARDGDSVVATMRNLDKAGALQKAAADAGTTIDLERLDVTDDASVRACVDAVLARHGRIDVLVNNAGISGGGPVETVPMDLFRSVMETNFWGPVRMIQAVVPGMRDRRSGVVINVSSLSGLLPGMLYNGPYAASKHALNAMSEALAMEVEPFGIGVVSIEPGFFATEISTNSEGRELGAEGTAYEADSQWWSTFMNRSVDAGADPAIVADAIVAAAKDPTPLHQPQGDDAVLYVELLRNAGGFEGWVATSLPVVESQVGPRPQPD